MHSGRRREVQAKSAVARDPCGKKVSGSKAEERIATAAKKVPTPCPFPSPPSALPTPLYRRARDTCPVHLLQVYVRWNDDPATGFKSEQDLFDAREALPSPAWQIAPCSAILRAPIAASDLAQAREQRPGSKDLPFSVGLRILSNQPKALKRAPHF